MAYRFLFTLASILISGAIFTACGESGPLKVDGISIALDENGKKGDTVGVLKPNDNPFHAIIHLNQLGSGATVRMDLVAIGVDQGKDLTVLSERRDLGGINNQLDLTISLPRPWPIATYRIDAYLNDSLSLSREFKVQE
ncbi:MAG: hypothetical protein KDD67_11735 [Ignavibacteriae bacterium]|nr:hypothetical protein [Ignavibacteriota bacterium]MCB9214956.1 hypothetical protein [Ignavibacteria bacterium]